MSNLPTVCLVSGQRLEIEKIKLYSRIHLIRAANARAAAAKAGAGSGMGVGAFGAPGVALAAEIAAISVLTSMMNKAANTAAVENLKYAQAALEKAKQSGGFFESVQISGLEIPDPTSWEAVGPKSDALVSIQNFSTDERKTFCEKHGLQYGRFMETQVVIPLAVKYGHSGEDFVHVIAGGREVAFRWSQIESYIPSNKESAVSTEQTEDSVRRPVFVAWR